MTRQVFCDYFQKELEGLDKLSMVNPESRKYLQEEMNKFFFGGGSQKPKEYVPLD
jgi:Fe-S cluster biosynthesis and repair protein YggX